LRLGKKPLYIEKKKRIPMTNENFYEGRGTGKFLREKTAPVGGKTHHGGERDRKRVSEKTTQKKK